MITTSDEFANEKCQHCEQPASDIRGSLYVCADHARAIDNAWLQYVVEHLEVHVFDDAQREHARQWITARARQIMGDDASNKGGAP